MKAGRSGRWASEGLIDDDERRYLPGQRPVSGVAGEGGGTLAGMPFSGPDLVRIHHGVEPCPGPVGGVQW